MDDFNRKQLPLRQQRDKPTFKYSGSHTNGVQYYHQGAGGIPGYQNKTNRTGTAPATTTTVTNNYASETPAYHGSYSSLVNGTEVNTIANIYGSQYSTMYKPTAPQPAYGNYFFMTNPGNANGLNLTPAQILSASIQTSTKVAKNPYARPISAKDVAPPENKPNLVKNSSSNSSINSVGSGGTLVRSPSATSIQMNSFLRPQSTGEPNNNLPMPSAAKPMVEQGKPTYPQAENISRSSQIAKFSPDFLMTQPAPKPPALMKQTNSRPNSGTQRSAQTPTQIVHGAVTEIISKKPLHPAATPTYPTSKPEAGGSDGNQTQPSVHFKPPPGPSAIKRTNSVSGATPANRFTDRFPTRPGSGSRPSSGNSDSGRVRNPNYTPSKPYSEVSDPSSGSSSDSSDSRSPSSGPEENTSNNNPAESLNHTNTIPENTKPNNNISKFDKNHNHQQSNQGSKSNHGPLQNNIHSQNKKNNAMSKKEDPQVIKDSSVKKMPVTNTLTGTVFYRKASKAEEVLREVKKRPLADGAPASARRKEVNGSARQQGGRKDEEEEDDEWTDEDEDEAKMGSERLPGDGEDYTNYDDDADDDDEAIDNLEDDFCSSDDESDTYSIRTGSRQSSAARIRVRSATKRLQNISLRDTSASPTRQRPATAKSRSSSAVSRTSVSDSELQPALMPSLFPNVPPTINFVLDGEKVESIPWEFRKLLKWRMSPITPNVVKNCIARSNFRATKKNHDWLGYWGKHMKAPGFKAIREYQKINHFPGSFQIGRKDRLWRNLSKMQVHFGKKEFNFFPQTFILPIDMLQLKRVWEDGGNKQKWIIKPPASARGIGIKVISKWNQIPKKRPVIVQRYLGRPYLINESKFDLRIYVYVTSYDPLRIYVYDDGLVRFASTKYSYSMKNINNKYMHLTNYSINKKNNEYEANADETVCQGHKWGLKALWGYMKKQGINTNTIWENIKDLVVKTIISSESCVNSMVKANVRRRFCCHELFGFDVMLDENLKPWIIEVNISPSLHSNSQLDMNIKGGMIRDLFNIAGFMFPEKADLTAACSYVSDISRYTPSNPLVIDKRMYPNQCSPDERAKHAYYCQRHLDEFIQSTINDTLTPDDIRMLIETIDEDSRRGNMQRVFPSNTSHKYLRFFEQPRYYNLLLNQWVQKYSRMEARGVALMESLATKGLHLENPTDDPKHQWAPPSMMLPRDPRPVTSAPLAAQGKTGSLPTLKKKRALGLDGTSSLGGSTSSTPHPPSMARSAGAAS